MSSSETVIWQKGPAARRGGPMPRIVDVVLTGSDNLPVTESAKGMILPTDDGSGSYMVFTNNLGVEVSNHSFPVISNRRWMRAHHVEIRDLDGEKLFQTDYAHPILLCGLTAVGMSFGRPSAEG